ncbi:MAG TPA: gamma-glutamyltransferase [Anaeromyxobacteraceae bacterium]|nr:gamma-glutamyltransferase [Anaeromyxobacteraceae bacterium]
MAAPAALALPALLGYVAVSPQAAVATAHPLASEAAAEVLRLGGNAADAAVAAAFALSVVEPESSGIGGGGLALVYTARDRQVHAIDFRETAPAAARPDMFLRDGKPSPALSRCGGLSVAVPGAVKGYAEIAHRFGRISLRRLVEPAARIAEGGFAVGSHYRQAAQAALACLRESPAAASSLLAASPAGPQVPAPGHRLVRRDLARTLRLVGRDPESFYRGSLAIRIAAAVRARGGILDASDLAGYRTRERQPLWGSYRGHPVAAFPPPSSGGAIVLGLLGALEEEDPRDGWRAERLLHVFVEAEKRLFARRAGELGDPDLVPGALRTAEEMSSREFAHRIHASIGERATSSEDLSAPIAPGHTSHISVVDGEGNAVALTTTVNLPFGSGIEVPGTGILLNDQMDDFDAAPGTPNAFGLEGTGSNAPEPGKRPLSSMAPTLVFAPSGELLLAVGSPGGSTIPATVAWTILHLLDDHMPLDQALGAPRVHHQWRPDVVLVEPFALYTETRRALEARGHRLKDAERPFGNPQAVRVDPATGWREGASEPRYEGRAAAP